MSCSRIISTPDGRQLRLFERGRSEGVPVLVQRGTPQSCLLYHRWVEDAQSRNIRLICYERPGYGESTRHPGRSVASAANDVATIAEALRLKKIAVWGISGGGPHALACAALFPGLVVAAAALGCIAPYPAEGLDYFAGMGEDNVADFKAALKGGEEHRQTVEASASKLLNADLQSVSQALQSLLCPGDAAALTTDFAGFVLQSVREGIGNRLSGGACIERDESPIPKASRRMVAGYAGAFCGRSPFRGIVRHPSRPGYLFDFQ